MTALPAEALHVGDRHALHAQSAQGFTHFLELEGLDDGGYEFHELLPLCSAGRNRAAREHWARARLNSRPFPSCAGYPRRPFHRQRPSVGVADAKEVEMVRVSRFAIVPPPS